MALKPAVVVAKIGDTEYTDLHLALTEATAGQTVELVNDVDLTGVAWEPVAFAGAALDGKGFTISNLAVAKDGDKVGFFTTVGSVTIKDVTFAGASVTATTGDKHGIIVGLVDGGAVFQNIVITNSTISGVKYVGAVYGHTDNTATFTNVKVVDSVISGSDAQIGPLFGYSAGAVNANGIEIHGNTINGKKSGALCGRANGDHQNFVNINIDQPSYPLIGSYYNGGKSFDGADTEVNVNAIWAVSEGTTGSIAIKAGTWSVDPSGYVPAGYIAEAGVGVWTVRALAQVALTVTADNATVTGIESGTVLEGSNLTFTVAADTGYNLVSVTANGATLTPVSDTYTYAVTGSETAGALAIVVTTEKAAEPVPPGEIPVVPVDEEADAIAMTNAINSAKADYIAVPSGVSSEGYLALFEASYSQNATSGKYDVKVDLTPAAQTMLQEQVNTDAAATITDTTAASATLTTTPGLYYAIIGGTEVGTITTAGTEVMATEASTSLTKPDLGVTTKAFYKVRVSISATAK